MPDDPRDDTTASLVGVGCFASPPTIQVFRHLKEFLKLIAWQNVDQITRLAYLLNSIAAKFPCDL